MEPNGFGAILAADCRISELETVLAQMRALARVPLASSLHEWSSCRNSMAEIPTTTASPRRRARGHGAHPRRPISIFQVTGIEIEGDERESDWTCNIRWEDFASPLSPCTRCTSRLFYIDRYPVTNAEFKKFLDATHYRPADDHNFLKDWTRRDLSEGWANKPVTWVSLEDARAYAAWAGKRLPHEWEWQYAAQGTDGRLYPWGNAWDAAPCPRRIAAAIWRRPSDVDAHPQGASPFGVMDMVGNVWQWTDEFMDDHTRAAILRGGSHYQPQGSDWYFPQAYKLIGHGKYLLMAPSIDRSGTIGFRCVVDAQ